MNILVVIGGYPPEFTGAGFRTHRMYRSLLKSEKINRVIVLTKSVNKRNDVPKIFRDGIEIISVPGNLPIANRKQNNQIFSFLKLLTIIQHATLTAKIFFSLQKEIDIVHTIGSGWFETIIAYCATIVRKPIAKEIVLLGTDDPGTLYRKKNILLKLFFVAPFKFAKLIITLSNPLKDTCKKFSIPDSKIWCRPNPIYIKNIINRHQVDSLHFLFKRPSILYVGIMEKRKNIEFLIRSSQYLSGKIQLIFIGPFSDKSYQQTIQSLSKELSLKSNGTLNFKFLGRIDDRNLLAEIYRRSSLFWFASFKEGLPNVVIESLACGTPVVTLPVDGIMKEIFTKDNSECGEVVDTICPKEFASVANKWLKKKHNGRSISKKANAISDNKKIEADYIKYFQKILNN